MDGRGAGGGSGPSPSPRKAQSPGRPASSGSTAPTSKTRVFAVKQSLGGLLVAGLIAIDVTRLRPKTYRRAMTKKFKN